MKSAEETGISDHCNTSDLQRNYVLTALSPPASNVSLSESCSSSWDPFGPDDECQDVQVKDEDGRVRNVTRVRIGNLKEIPEVEETAGGAADAELLLQFGEPDSEHVYNEHNSSLLLLQGGWNRTGAVIHVRSLLLLFRDSSSGPLREGQGNGEDRAADLGKLAGGSR